MTAALSSQKLPSRYWADLSTLDFAAIDPARAVAVLPVSAIEQHGPHLPLSVDANLVDGIIERALPLLPDDSQTLVLPSQHVGLSPEHIKFPGTLTLSPATVIALWTDIGESVARAGIKKLILFNSHGGQVSVMDIVAREIRTRSNLIVYSASWYSLPIDPAVMQMFSPQEHRFGVHAGEIETSMMLALKPELVDMSLAKNFASTSQERAQKYPILGNGKSAKLGWQMQDYNEDGAAGNAAAATAEKGNALIDSAAKQLAALIAEVAALPLSTLSD